VEYYVYVIESISTGRRYVGHTNDLSRRISEHNSREHNPAKYTTKQKGPWKLIYSDVFTTRSEAMKRERWLKSGRGRDWLKSKLADAGPPQAD
jgi:putative endonuclease